MFTEEIGHPKTLFGAIMTEVDSFANHVFHECPYNGEFRVLNFNNGLEIKLFATVTIRNGTYL